MNSDPDIDIRIPVTRCALGSVLDPPDPALILLRALSLNYSCDPE